MPQLRLIPIVIFAAACLLVLKTAGFFAGETRDPFAGLFSGADAVATLASGADDDVDITGATPEAKPPPAGGAAPPPMAALSKTAQNSAGAASETAGGSSRTERALYERLQERRQELEARARDLEMRENLIKAAEKRLDGRIDDLKELEGKGGESAARLKSLIMMYEVMRPKDAARIFDRLEVKTLVDIANQMNPRKLADVMSQMGPEAAERLTLELIKRKSGADKALPATDLPKIEGPLTGPTAQAAPQPPVQTPGKR